MNIEMTKAENQSFQLGLQKPACAKVLSNIRSLSDQGLHVKLQSLAKKERELLTETLKHLREAERRRLYSVFKRGSLFEYTVKDLGYSEDQAFRRIQAMRY